MRTAPVVEDGQLIGLTLRSFDVTELRRLEREVIDVAAASGSASAATCTRASARN